MGKGIPVLAKLLPRSWGVKKAVLIGDKHGDQRSEVGDQRSDDRGQTTEHRLRIFNFEFRNSNFEILRYALRAMRVLSTLRKLLEAFFIQFDDLPVPFRRLCHFEPDFLSRMFVYDRHQRNAALGLYVS